MKFFFDAGDIFGVILVSDYKVFLVLRGNYAYVGYRRELFGVEAFSS